MYFKNYTIRKYIIGWYTERGMYNILICYLYEADAVTIIVYMVCDVIPTAEALRCHSG